MGLLRRPVLFALLAAAPLWAYVLYPVASLFLDSLLQPVAPWRAESLGWDTASAPWGAGLRALWHEPLAWRAAWGTLKLSLLTVIGGGIWGLGLALLWGRRDFPGRRYFALLGYVPALMPPLVGTVAFSRLLGETGVLWRLGSLAPGGKPWLSPFGAVLLLHVYAFGLFTYAFVAAALEHLDPAYEEAAHGLGGQRTRVFRHAVWPAIRAPLGAAALLTYMAAGASFSGPYLLDTNGHYLTVEILAQQGTSDRSLVAALTLLLTGISLAALPAFLYFQSHAPGAAAAAAGLKGVSGRPLPAARGASRAIRLGLSLAAALVLLLPPGMVVLSACGGAEGWQGTFLPPSLALPSLGGLGKEAWASLERSVVYGLLAAAADLVLALSLALALRRAPVWAALPAEGAVMLALALPGTAVAIALLSVFHAPSWLAGGLALGQTAAILILAYAVRALPLAVRPVRAALAAVGGDMESAARGLGAGAGMTMRRILVPLLAPTLLSAGLICFIASAGEFVASQLLYVPETRTASVTINTLLRDRPGNAAALAVCLMLIGAAAIALSGWLQARASWRTKAAADKI